MDTASNLGDRAGLQIEPVWVEQWLIEDPREVVPLTIEVAYHATVLTTWAEFQTRPFAPPVADIACDPPRP